MPATILSAALNGVDAYPVHVEVDTDRQLPSFTVVGLPDSTVRESKERVMAAIRNAGFEWPRRRVTVNLAPAHLRKEGSAFDLPIAVGILAASSQIRLCRAGRFILVGELSLDGTLRPARGVLCMASAARDRGDYGIIVPAANAPEAALADGPIVYAVETLREAVEVIEGRVRRPPFESEFTAQLCQPVSTRYDFSDVRGQDQAKRALEVAAAGGHNLLMIGPPGSGKTMLARRLPGILPDLSLEEALAATKIHSVAGMLGPKEALVLSRPFRAPHHSISDAGLIGGGPYPRPGEVSLAHHGVLFLDEMPEFKKPVIEALRQPLEDHQVTISRASGTLSYPARFMVVAAMNPCPCGYLSDPQRSCSCLAPVIQRYRARISGAVLDRMDLHVEVPPVRYRDLADRQAGEPSAQIRARVNRARQRQARRFAADQGLFCNADMNPRDVRAHLKVPKEAEELLGRAITKLGLSARAYDRVLKVALTIADLDERDSVEARHVGEAIQYRSLDRQLVTKW